MSEQLITKSQLANKLAITVRTLDRIRPTLLAGGLQEIHLPGSGGRRPLKRFRLASVDAELERAAKEGRAPWSRKTRK